MKIGIIGAGKMGYTLGKHFSVSDLPDIQLVGYYSRNLLSAIDAAQFTNSNYFEMLEELCVKCDMLFLTVPDGEIKKLVASLNELSKFLSGKIICHTSGALSSLELSGICSDVYVYSVHPIFAVNSKMEAYKNFVDAFITIEGDLKYIDYIKVLFTNLGHNVKVISPDDKVKYHSAAVFSSNLVIGLYHMAEGILKQCGFNDIEIDLALKPLFINNANMLYESNCKAALTGPVERCDYETLEKHLFVLQNDYYDVYKIISNQLVEIADNKHNERDYSKIMDLLS
ncbi:MAG: DUF2520 domain-containing protein [Lachnospiraceae bacterium]|nr:DUF2520 domain-containing protein [Lachnospiraceae bacterium]